MTTHVERSIEVAVPVRTAYDQWTQFEDFPRFMAGVQEVRQIGDALTHWVAEIAGVRREWDAAILEQVPDQKVAWAATTGATNAGAVYFQSVGNDRTQVRLTLDYEPEGLVEKIGDVLDVVDRQAVADLDRFKEFIEKRGEATGGWRGQVDEGDVQGSGAGPGSGAAAAAGAAVGATTAGGGGGSRAESAGVSGDVIAVGPTGDTHGTLSTEAGSAATGSSFAGVRRDVGHSGDPVALDPERATSGGTGGPGIGHSGDPVAVDAQHSSARTDAGDLGTAGPTADAAASTSTGVVGFGTDTGLRSDDPASGVLTGDPGARTAGHAGTGTGDLAGAPGVGRGETRRDVGESWSADEGGAGVAGSTTDASDQPVAQRDFANRDVTNEGGVQRDFANRDITNQDVADRGISTGMGGARPNVTSARSGIEGDTGWSGKGTGTATGAGTRPSRSEPTSLDAADAPGPADGTDAGLDPLDPRTGTADDPENPQRPSV